MGTFGAGLKTGFWISGILAIKDARSCRRQGLVSRSAVDHPHDPAPRRQRAAFGWTLALLIVQLGCSSSAAYNAASLPTDLSAPGAKNLRSVNFTRLSSPRPASSLIGRGDLLELTIATGYESDRLSTMMARVDENGLINVPLIGRVAVAGLEPAEAEQNVAAAAVERGVFRQPYVTLTIKRQQSNKVTVVGAVEKPGIYELERGSSDLLGALAAAGGLTGEASTEVEIVRKSAAGAPPAGGPQLPSPEGRVAGALTSYEPSPPANLRPASVRVDLVQLSQSSPHDYGLSDGDAVMVFPEKPRAVHVMGLVRKPGQFDIPAGEDLYLLGALAMAGGRSIQVADKVKVIRRLPDQAEPAVIDASIREAKRGGHANIRLAPGDLVSVEESAATVVLDTLRSFIRFGVSASAPLF